MMPRDSTEEECTCSGEGDCEYCDPVGNYYDTIIELQRSATARKARLMAEPLTEEKVREVIGTIARQIAGTAREHGVTMEQLMAIYLAAVVGFAIESGESREDFIARVGRAYHEVGYAADEAARILKQQQRLD